jgi:hypothetical protein
LWVHQLTRDGVREALQARRFFATRERGFKLDIAANGVRMGGTLVHTGGRVRMVVDVDAGTATWGGSLQVQVLCAGDRLPCVKWSGLVRAPAASEPPLHFDLTLEAEETSWLVVRVSDPTRATEPPGPFGQRALAYSSPIFVTPPNSTSPAR